MDKSRTYWLGETSAVLEIPGETTLDHQRKIWSLAEHFRRQPGVREVVPGMNNLTVELDQTATDIEDLPTALSAGWAKAEIAEAPPRRIDIPVRYGGEAGPDLEVVARHTRLSVEEIIRIHSETEYSVYFLGFVAGFAYLGGLDRRLFTPRRREPRQVVPAGSVGIGGEQTGVYPSASPGGWQLIGRTSIQLFDPGRDSPSLLLPGDTVRFVETRGRP
jgi:KipI family sensor histidine kinase inhibitor